MPDPAFVHPGVPERIIYFTGVIALESALLDFMVGLLDGHQRNLSADEINTISMPEDTRRKAERCLKAATDPELKAALALIPDILADRNAFLHGVAVSSTPEGAAVQTAVYRGKHKLEPPDRAEDALVDLQNRIGVVNGVIAAIVIQPGAYVQPTPSHETDQ